jgi:hypothetical protein
MTRPRLLSRRPGIFVVAHPEFGDDGDIPTAVTERARQGLLGDSHAVGFSGVEAIDAVVDRRLDGAPELALVDPAVGAADLPATEPDRRDLEVGLAELPVFHAFPRPFTRSRCRFARHP